MKKLLSLLLLLSAMTVSSAQTNDELFHRFSVTLRPLGFFDPFTTNFTASVMYRVADQLVVEAQGGLIMTWYDLYDDSEYDVRKSGFRVSGELKYLFTKRLYVSGQVFHNNYIKTRVQTVWRYNYSYQEEMEVERHYAVTGAHVKFGVIVFRPEQRFFMDFYTGLGFRNRYVTIQNLPSDAEPDENDYNSDSFYPDSNDMEDSRTIPTVTLGFSMGIRIGK